MQAGYRQTALDVRCERLSAKEDTGLISRSGKSYIWLRYGRNRIIHTIKHLHGVDARAYVHHRASIATDLIAGPYVFIGRGCQIPPGVQIGRYTMLAPRTAIVGSDHNSAVPGVPMQFSGRPPQRRTEIGSDAWIGYGSILMRGITVGDGSIIAAGSIVTKNVPAFEIWAGVPARKLRDRFEGEVSIDDHRRMLSGALVPPTFAAPPSTLSKPQQSVQGELRTTQRRGRSERWSHGHRDK